MDIIEALTALKSDNDEHWTNNGLPRVDVLKEMTGVDGLTRSVIDEAAPDYTRENRFDLVAGDEQNQTPPPSVTPGPPVQTTDPSPPEQPTSDPVETEAPVESEESLNAKIAEMRAERDELSQERARLDTAVKKIDDEIFLVEKARQALYPPVPQAVAVQRYNQSQQEQRIAASKRRQAAVEAFGEDVVDPNGGISVIDRRRAARGRHERRASSIPSTVHS